MEARAVSDLLACVGPLTFFVLLFGFIAFMRYLRYRETIALAEKGLVHPAQVAGDGKGTLRWGIVIAFLGLALSIGFYPLGFLFNSSTMRFPLNFGPWMLVGILPLFFGLALILTYVVTREDKPKKEADKTEASKS